MKLKNMDVLNNVMRYYLEKIMMQIVMVLEGATKVSNFFMIKFSMLLSQFYKKYILVKKWLAQLKENKMILMEKKIVMKRN